MSHVFISYSSKDRDYAINLKDKLQEEGFDVWIDNANLHSSDNWWNTIVDALKKADAFIVIMTPDARASRWVEREVLLADEWEIPAFPLLLKGKKFEIYVRTHYLDVHNQELPPDSFFDGLEKYVHREAGSRGSDITPDEISLAALLGISATDLAQISTDAKKMKRGYANSTQNINIMMYVVVLVLIVSLTLVAIFSIVSANHGSDDPTPATIAPAIVELGIKPVNGVFIWAEPEQGLEHPIIVFQGAELISYAKTEANGQHWYLVLIPGKDKYGWVYAQDVYVKVGDEGNLPDYDSFADAKIRFPIAE